MRMRCYELGCQKTQLATQLSRVEKRLKTSEVALIAHVEKRGKRKAMTNYRAECEKLQREFGPGLGLCLVAYTLLGA